MDFNQFISKINLPEVCRMYGIKGLSYTKIPRFGWFAHNESLSQIVHLFQLFPDDEVPKLFHRFTVYKTEVQEFNVLYSEQAQERLYRDYLRIRTWISLFNDAVDEARNAYFWFDAKKYYLYDFFEKNNLNGLTKLKVGLITERLMTKYYKVSWTASDKNRIILPTYCTPLHTCSYDVVHPKSLQVIKNLYTNTERGWYGQIGGNICSGTEGIAKTPGFTWDKKADLWTRTPVEINSDVEVADCLKIWIEAQQTQFVNSPLDVIKANKKEDEIILHHRILTREKVREAETKLGISLLKNWEKQQQQEIQLGNIRFIQKDNQYLIECKSNGTISDYSNFTIQIDSLVKTKKNQFLRKGKIKYQDKVEDFMFYDTDFKSTKALLETLRSFFLHHGLGTPYVLSNYKNYLVDVVERFNQNVPVVSL